jgi:hypothetical protein
VTRTNPLFVHLRALYQPLQGFRGLAGIVKHWAMIMRATLDVLGPMPVQPYDPSQLADQLLTRYLNIVQYHTKCTR